MASAALTPGLALNLLLELSVDVRAAALLDARGAVAATHPDEAELGEALGAALRQLLDAADRCATADGAPPGEGERPAEIEVASPAGSVLVARRGGSALAVVVGRDALSSLVRYDLRMVLSDLEREAA